MNPSRLPLFLLLAASCPLALASDPVTPAAQPTPTPTPDAHAHAHPAAKPGMDLDRMFAMADADKDGSVSRAEFGAYHAAMHKAHAEAMHPGADGCLPMEHVTASEADDAPKADAGK